MIEPEIMDEVFAKIDIMDSDELNQVIGAIKDRRGVIARRLGSNFQKGDRVQFEAKGRIIIGIVEKVNKKSVSLHEEDNKFHSWRVGPSLLQKVD